MIVQDAKVGLLPKTTRSSQEVAILCFFLDIFSTYGLISFALNRLEKKKVC
jgi:hypothetical protein